MRNKGVAVALACTAGVGWTLLSVLFGLLQLWLLLASCSILKNPPPVGDQIVMDGVLLFFATALVTALTVDYFFAPDKTYPKLMVGLLYGLYPAVILIVSVWLFTLCFGKSTADVSLSLVKNGQYAVATMVLLYAIVVKTLEFCRR